MFFITSNVRAAGPRFNTGELLPAREVIQLFKATDNNLQQIEIYFSTLGRSNRCSLKISLIELASATTIAERYPACQDIQDGKPITLIFQPITHSKNAQFKLTISSPDATAGNSVSLIAEPEPELEGTLTVGGGMVAGGLIAVPGYRYGGYLSKYREAIVFATIFFVLLAIGTWVRWWLWCRNNRIKGTVKLFIQQLNQNKLEIAALSIFFLMYMLAIPYGPHADEYDNILGGLLINQGILPYTGFFAHHMPLPYYISSLITLFTGNDVWAFRAIFIFLLYIWALGIYTLLRNYVGKWSGIIFLGFISSTMLIFWGYQLLAETLIGYATITLLILFLFKYKPGNSIKFVDVTVVSLLLAVIITSSLGYLFLGIWLYAGFLYLLVRQPNIKFKILNFVKCALILITPYLFWGVILLVTGGIGKFFFDNYTFNTNYYSQFQSEPQFLYIQNGPIESLALIAKRFANGLEAATKNPLSPETYQAFFSLLAVLALICYWGYRKQAFKLIIFIPVIILLNPRAGIGQSWEVATYLGGPFIVVSFFAAAVVLIKAFAYLNQNKEAYVLRTVLYLLLPFTMFAWFSAISFSANTYFGYFTQSSLNLVSREETPTAKIVNTLTTKEDYAWVVPFDLETPIFQKARQASYHYFLAPWITACGDCKKRILEDLATNKPKIIVWSKNKSLWDQKMDSAASDILDYIKKNYFTVGNSRKQLLDNFYFLRDKEDSIRSELQAKGYT